MSPADFRRALKALGWSQARAARELGASNQQRVSEWHRGIRPVPRYIAAHIARAIELKDITARLRRCGERERAAMVEESRRTPSATP